MARLFRDLPEALASTEALGERLDYTMADLGYRFPDYPVPPGETHSSFLRKLTDLGARERYRPYHDRARAQITRELDLIERLDLAGYFLIVWDIVNFCRHHDILVQGRGSAANSAVCYSLGITAVDPVGMDLLFERFLSEERGEWPDIDLDLPSGDRREQVIQHVYEKYGRLGRGDDGERHHLSRQERGARSREDARHRRDAGRSPREGDESVRVHRSGRHAAQADGRGRLRSRSPDLPMVRRAVEPHAGSAAASRAAFRRHGDLPGAARQRRAARERQHARPRRAAVGQGRLRRHGARQSRSARPRDDGRAAGRDHAGE